MNIFKTTQIDKYKPTGQLELLKAWLYLPGTSASVCCLLMMYKTVWTIILKYLFKYKIYKWVSLLEQVLTLGIRLVELTRRKRLWRASYSILLTSPLSCSSFFFSSINSFIRRSILARWWSRRAEAEHPDTWCKGHVELFSEFKRSPIKYMPNLLMSLVFILFIAQCRHWHRRTEQKWSSEYLF